MGRVIRKGKLYDNPETENAFAEQSPAKVEMTGPETINGIVVNTLFVNVRKAASFDSDVVELLRKGDKIIILGKEGDFYKVSTKVNDIAYVSSDFIKEE